MSQPFTFPPPPPPPPKPAQHDALTPFQTRGGHRGRGNSGSRGRGRGQNPSSNQSRGGYGGHGNGMNNGYSGQQQQHYQTSNSNHRGFHASHDMRQHAGEKREHSTAFRSDDTLRRSRPSAPPAVPSFSVDFDALLAKNPQSGASKVVETASGRVNALGLTPQTNGHESDEEDVDEEAELARKGRLNDALEFEYQGQTSVLKSSEEIAAWIAERRKKWPTQEKRDEAAKEAEEKRRKWQEEKEARAKASQVAAKARQEEYLKQKAEKEKSRVRQKLLQEQIKKAKEKATANVPQTDAEAKAERLRRKAERIAKQLGAAEQALQRKKQRASGEDDIDALVNRVDQKATSKREAALDLDDDDGDKLSSLPSSSDQDPEDTSTSGSSSSDTDTGSDSDPEQSSTKRTGPERVLAPPRKPAPGTTSDTRQPCQKFVRTGQCRYGKKCRYRHDKADRKATQQKEHGVGNRRKGLYQLMVDKEKDEERRRALRAIIAIGKAGLLDDPGERNADRVEGYI